jgi:hypothetical protein
MIAPPTLKAVKNQAAWRPVLGRLHLLLDFVPKFGVSKTPGQVRPRACKCHAAGVPCVVMRLMRVSTLAAGLPAGRADVVRQRRVRQYQRRGARNPHPAWAPVPSSRASPPHRPREDGLAHPADTPRTDLASALGMLSRGPYLFSFEVSRTSRPVGQRADEVIAVQSHLSETSSLLYSVARTCAHSSTATANALGDAPVGRSRRCTCCGHSSAPGTSTAARRTCGRPASSEGSELSPEYG